MVKKIQKLNLRQLYPEVLANINLNTCGDPDCGNFGVAPDFSLSVFKGKNAAERKAEAAGSIPALSSGLGSYSVSSKDHNPRISEVFEYEEEPVGWDDGRDLKCGHQRGNGFCCKCWIKIPQKCWRKIPHFSGSVISRGCDWRLRSWAVGRAFSGAAGVRW